MKCYSAFVVVVAIVSALQAGCPAEQPLPPSQPTNAFTRFKSIERITLRSTTDIFSHELEYNVPQSEWDVLAELLSRGIPDSNLKKRIVDWTLHVAADGADHEWLMLSDGSAEGYVYLSKDELWGGISLAKLKAFRERIESLKNQPHSPRIVE